MAGFFDISGDTVKAAEAAGSFKLMPPATAKEDKKSGAKSWTESGRVKLAQSETAQIDMEGRKVDVLVLKLELDISKEGSGLNEGKTLKAQFRINRYALLNGKGAEKGTQMQKQHSMSQISIPKLKQVLSACGFAPDTEDGGFSQNFLAELFPDVSNFAAEASPLLGQAFWFELKERSSEGKDGRTYTNYDIQNVLETP